VGESSPYLCIVIRNKHLKHTTMKKTMSKMKVVRLFRKAGRCFLRSFVEISKHTNHSIYCSRFYNPYVM